MILKNKLIALSVLFLSSCVPWNKNSHNKDIVIHEHLINDFERNNHNQFQTLGINDIEIIKRKEKKRNYYYFTTWKNAKVVLPDSLFDYSFKKTKNRIYYWEDSLTNQNSNDFYNSLLNYGRKLDSCPWFDYKIKKDCSLEDISIPHPTYIVIYSVDSKGNIQVANRLE
ncbi:hypothetical protein I5168_07995 [Nonlabens sp. SCSIO 43208]|uniref:hypothetical protein n=1 Tax=Nonlabens sp. SCSIO 43208 TaxID=2793009 RepID=UPI003D6C5848